MLRSVAGVTESFAAAWILAGIWFLAGMRSEMSLQILQSWVGFEATLKLYSRKYSINCVITITNVRLYLNYDFWVRAIKLN